MSDQYRAFGNDQYSFSRAPAPVMPRSTFSRNSKLHTTFDSGFLYPIRVAEMYPGDTVECSIAHFCRMATPAHPILDEMTVETFGFFAANRYLWENWERFNGAQDEPGDPIDFMVPKVITGVGGEPIGSMTDYFGFPTGVSGFEMSALPYRAYGKIIDDWFRPQEIIAKGYRPTDNGPDDLSQHVLRRRAKRHDYFTSATLAPQRGDPVILPLLGTAPVVPDATNQPSMRYEFGANEYRFYGAPATDPTISVAGWNRTPTDHVGGNMVWGTSTGLEAQLSAAQSLTVNDLRNSFAVQRVLERDARGGTRYVELLKHRWGVTSPDFRLQRPEFLGSSSSPLNVHVTPQTAPEAATTSNVGDLGAYATSSHQSRTIRYSAVEHGIFMVLVNVRGPLIYQQGMPREFTRFIREEFYHPEFANLGEQAILNKEVLALGDVDPAWDIDAFGYQERWAELRHGKSIVTGKMRSADPQTLDTWHLAQQFSPVPGSRPVLNEAFIQEDPPVSRVVIQQDEPEFIFDAFFQERWTRPLPVYSVPGLIDHF